MYWWWWFGGWLVARARDLHVLAAFGLAALLAGHIYLGLFSPYGLLKALTKPGQIRSRKMNRSGAGVREL
jgi:hypothetical protein